MGKPSHDRVKFFLSRSRVYNEPFKFRELLRETLDMSPSQFDEVCREHNNAYGGYCHGAIIVCRPSQFARFLIKRNELGLNNGFKELNPELFLPEAERNHIDVSKRTHKDPRMGHGCGSHDEDEQL